MTSVVVAPPHLKPLASSPRHHPHIYRAVGPLLHSCRTQPACVTAACLAPSFTRRLAAAVVLVSYAVTRLRLARSPHHRYCSSAAAATSRCLDSPLSSTVLSSTALAEPPLRPACVVVALDGSPPPIVLDPSLFRRCLVPPSCFTATTSGYLAASEPACARAFFVVVASSMGRSRFNQRVAGLLRCTCLCISSRHGASLHCTSSHRATRLRASSTSRLHRTSSRTLARLRAPASKRQAGFTSALILPLVRVQAANARRTYHGSPRLASIYRTAWPQPPALPQSPRISIAAAFAMLAGSPP
ncbi:hypothetical protein ZWY2020_034493 [Hordeum vulgare]|nr:hypothetical protein ZWY2020_034493 [Hordeum vulgare]